MSRKANYLVIMYLFTKMSQGTGFKIIIAVRIFNLVFTVYLQRRCLKIPSQNEGSQATFSTQCTHLATRLSSITTATTGQTTLGSGTQLDLLMMGIKMPETC